MIRVFACYGHPADPAAFDAYYDNTHTPLTLQIPGLAGLTAGKCRPLTPGQQTPYYMVAAMMFESAEDFNTALKSPEMASASADVANFATGGVTLFSSEEITRG
jgi:uncharacterized protein (TIGR02118 family)